ncbi:hypothetical protein Hypma_009802 [Hypsizygus marmoreus]|uniref:Uncharacterized protein n=1 Tax=Hypsizygus marmoreus TaxID=39966 RepID=A0A369JM90_HYPMA|nr:hypothetical protein Hypma_009802 [Hypsizygus marmoreus]
MHFNKDHGKKRMSHNLCYNPPPSIDPGIRCIADPLIHHGRHFGWTIHAMCNVQALITNGLLRLGELAAVPDESFTAEERRQFRVFRALLQMIPCIEERIINGDDGEPAHVADMIQKGAASARSDDTKSLKGPIIDWITPRDQPLRPPLARNVKIDRGFNHEVTGALLCPAELNWSDPEIKQQLRSGERAVLGDQWPIFLYANCKYDPEDPWEGLLRNTLLVSASTVAPHRSMEKEPKATRSENARLHGMTKATTGSIAYIATQTRFALCSSAVFSRTDTVTDSERFYSSILDLLEDPEEKAEVDRLLAWWNQQIFPNYSTGRKPAQNTALCRIQARRALLFIQNQSHP